MKENQHDATAPWQCTSLVEEGAIDHEKIIGEVGVVNDTVIVRVAQRVDYDLLADPVRMVAHAPRITLGGMFEMDDVQGELIGHSMLSAVSFVRSLPVAATAGRERILLPSRRNSLHGFWAEQPWRRHLLALKGRGWNDQ